MYTKISEAIDQAMHVAGSVSGFRRDVDGQASVKALIGVLIFLVIGVALVGVVAAEVAGADQANLSGGSLALFLLLPLIFVIVIVVGAIKFLG